MSKKDLKHGHVVKNGRIKILYIPYYKNLNRKEIFKKKPDEKILNFIFKELLFYNSYDDQKTIYTKKDFILRNIVIGFKSNIDYINKYLKVKIKKIETLDNCLSIAKMFLDTTEFIFQSELHIIKKIRTTYFFINTKDFQKIKKEQYKPKIITFD